jgi:hypothetical protein
VYELASKQEAFERTSTGIAAPMKTEGTKLMKHVLAGLLASTLLVLCVSCQQPAGPANAPHGAGTADEPQGGKDPAALGRPKMPVADAVRQRWLKDRSYYAFLEIADAELDPFFPGATMQDVEKALGPPTCKGPDCYPNFTERHWIYDTKRNLPAASHAILLFDERGVLQSLEWVSE